MKEIKSINECETIEEARELLNKRYSNWYSKPANREKRLEYYREYYKKRKLENMRACMSK